MASQDDGECGRQGIVLRMANVVAWIVGVVPPISLFVVGFALCTSRGIVEAHGAGNALMLVGVALVGVMILVVTGPRSGWRARRSGKPGSGGRSGRRSQGANGSRMRFLITLYDQVAAPLDAFAAEHGLTLEEGVNPLLAERLGEPELDIAGRSSTGKRTRRYSHPILLIAWAIQGPRRTTGI
jgi:hypothetical protein